MDLGQDGHPGVRPRRQGRVLAPEDRRQPPEVLGQGVQGDGDTAGSRREGGRPDPGCE